MSLYRNFKTSANLETDGVTFELFGNRVKMARAGASNKDFQAYITNEMRPYRQMALAGKLDPEIDTKIMRKAFSLHIVRDWEVLEKKDKDDEGTWVRGIPDQDGGRQEFTKDNVLKVLTDLPDFFAQLINLAQDGQNFLETERTGKN